MEIFRKGVEEGVHQTRMCFIRIEYSQHSLFDDRWISQLSSNHPNVIVHSTQSQVDQVASLSESSTPRKVMLLDKNKANQLISVLICLTKVAVLFSSSNLQIGARRMSRGMEDEVSINHFSMLWDVMRYNTIIHPDPEFMFFLHRHSLFFFQAKKTPKVLPFLLGETPKTRPSMEQPLVVWVFKCWGLRSWVHHWVAWHLDEGLNRLEDMKHWTDGNAWKLVNKWLEHGLPSQ